MNSSRGKFLAEYDCAEENKMEQQYARRPLSGFNCAIILLLYLSARISLKQSQTANFQNDVYQHYFGSYAVYFDWRDHLSRASSICIGSNDPKNDSAKSGFGNYYCEYIRDYFSDL